ncbi:hypothetical protein H6P81_007929 [Aristolochia fimbriata]|uniref:Lipid droplet-associated hydrolase n=1 Tax=Aristolochia fimbriata TaxID=158543 RepID=A0AAV7F1L0_ARIFI|nr:hypothetical protein H6P81_007929 [Aristolochia fimbriata]
MLSIPTLRCVSRFIPRIPAHRRLVSALSYQSIPMDEGTSLQSETRQQATNRLCYVSSFTTELLEISSEHPLVHVLLIPGNPGVAAFYKDFVEAVYQLFEGNASVTAIGHISQTKKNFEGRRLFSLQDQIDHKVNFINQELQNEKVPILLVGHSIGAYIALEVFRRFPEQVIYTIGLYPFLTLNRKSLVQSILVRVTASKILTVAFCSILTFLGLLPNWFKRILVKRFVGQSCSTSTIGATCSHLLQYSTMQNVLYMAMTEFRKLSEQPDWAFFRANQTQLAFLFGINDHWGPLTLYEEISKHAPDLPLTIEREGHTHAFCCTEAGSIWVAHYVVGLIKNRLALG